MADELVPCPKDPPTNWPNCFLAMFISVVVAFALFAVVSDYGDRRERAGRESERAVIARIEEAKEEAKKQAEAKIPSEEPRLFSGTRTWCESLEKTSQIAPRLALFLYAYGSRKVTGPSTGEFKLRSAEDVDLWVLGNKVNQELAKLGTDKVGEAMSDELTRINELTKQLLDEDQQASEKMKKLIESLRQKD